MIYMTYKETQEAKCVWGASGVGGGGKGNRTQKQASETQVEK